MRKENDFWLIDANCVGVIDFYAINKNKDDLIEYMFIEEDIVMGIHGENPPLMKTRKNKDRVCKIVLEKFNNSRMAKN